MTLDERLERARDDYRSLDVPDAPAVPSPGARPGGAVRAAVAAVVLLLVGGAVGWAVLRDDDPAGRRVRSTPSAVDLR